MEAIKEIAHHGFKISVKPKGSRYPALLVKGTYDWGPDPKKPDGQEPLLLKVVVRKMGRVNVHIERDDNEVFYAGGIVEMPIQRHLVVGMDAQEELVLSHRSGIHLLTEKGNEIRIAIVLVTPANAESNEYRKM